VVLLAVSMMHLRTEDEEQYIGSIDEIMFIATATL
jgi:hypothetical protein